MTTLRSYQLKPVYSRFWWLVWKAAKFLKWPSLRAYSRWNMFKIRKRKAPFFIKE